ncbi:unnamed protein product [Nippostrongylus brasiliensis]|uniref:Ribosomal_L7Ae domain-containing protein n=1 Tax=Nippostrongylus brasiliensis TaxID=27835 RepID=A0A0N4YXW1_NIPBR|nr:unnamed protein product [Nippostrongylus brasiliensis]
MKDKDMESEVDENPLRLREAKETVEGGHSIEQCARKNGPRKKKKPREENNVHSLAQVVLTEFISDNALRAMVGLKKVKNRTVPHLAEPSRNTSDSAHLPKKDVKAEKKLTKTKKQLVEARERCNTLLIEESFSPSALDEVVIDILKRLRKQADTIFKENPTKARAKRTFVCGLHESLKHLKADNVRCVIVARNINDEVTAGSTLFHSLRDECLNRNIPMVHASTKRLLSRALQKFPYTNIIALFYFQGFEELYRRTIDLWMTSESHVSYHLDQMSLFA